MAALHTVLAFPQGVIPTLLVGYHRIIEILLQKFTLDLLENSAEFSLRLTDLRVFLNLIMIILVFQIYKEVSCNL